MQDCRIELRSRGICVIVPTYNNAGTIVDVVSRSQKFCSDVIVVCDGCTDGTVALLESMDSRPEIVVIEKNSGKGNALKTGFRHARQKGFAYAITLDADGQHYPEDIPLMLEANINHPGALIVGSRMGLEKVERDKSSSFANKFSNFWFFVQTLHPLKDTQTGYRLYPLNKLGGLSLLTSRYEAELELLVFSAWKGTEIVSRDVHVWYPPKEKRVSHFRPAYDFTRISILNCCLCILALVYGLPRTFLRKLWRFSASSLTFFLYAVLMFFIIAPGVFIYMNLGKTTEKKKEKLHSLICRVPRFIIERMGLPGIRYTKHNDHNEDFSKPAVIICNHQSHLDLLPLLALTPKLVVLTTDWVWNDVLLGNIIRKADYLRSSDGLDVLTERAKELAAKGYSIAIYPEGTRSMDSRIGRFHQGAFHLAQELQIDILPAVLYGAGRALPKYRRVLRPWPIHLSIEQRISPAELADMGSLKKQASQMRAYYSERYRQMADKIEQTEI